MRAVYSALRCPHCGSDRFNIVEEDIFLCEYCNQKFNYDLQNLEINDSNKIFIEELKTAFYEKIEELEIKKYRDKKLLSIYSAKETMRKLECFSFIALTIAIFFMLCIFSLPIISVFALPCVAFFIVAKKIRKKAYEKYHSIVVLYASNIVDYDEQIKIYSRLISKLTK